ncbi:hypothetical protein ILUMI_12419 [Ignelater luminosus]|uniref:FAS1 domain-containing protein n=1 Tax=Ignelater luminosus TaxID=2038154 RepID=A0A8K0CYH5_IGNLU|nr:hypothetical protein ILUMI_12419 [Ignelater luminosus]
MLTQALLLGIFVLGAQCYYGDLDALPEGPSPFAAAHSQWNWRLPDLYTAESRNKEFAEGRDIEEVTERDREPLAPDYTDPGSRPKDEKHKPAPQPPSYNPSALPGGVVDVDASGFGFPQIPDTFGFTSTFSNRRPDGSDFFGLGGLGGFFGPIAERKPWWKGENVCIEREETTDDEDGEVQSRENTTEAEKVPNFFSTSISLSNCQQTPSKYECITKINNHGVVKTFVVRYKCCYGYKRTENSPGCTKKIDLLPLLPAIEDVGGKEFRNLIRATDLEDRFNSENLTVFVPTDMALTEFSEKMTELNQVDLHVEAARRRRQVKNPVSSKNLVLNHILPGFVDISELSNEDILYSENDNSTIRLNIYPTRNYGKMITANCARVRKGDNLATNGIVHVIEGVLNPVSQNVLEIIAEHPQLKNLNEALKNSDLVKNFKPNGHYTVFAPTDEAFNKLAESSKQKLLKGDACASTILKHHIVAHTVCSSAIIGNATTHNVDGELLNLQRTDEDVLYFENNAKIVKTDILGTNGVIHLIDVVVIPDSALYIGQALKSENLTKFQDIIEKAGLADEIDSMKNVTVFAPSNEAFSNPETTKLLDEIKDDKDKLKELVLYHTVQGRLESCDMNNNALLKTNNNDKILRLNLYSTLPVFTNIINRATVNCARLTGYDEKSCGSVIHEVGSVLVPPTRNLLETLNGDENYSVVSQLLKGTDLESILKDSTQSLTFLAPSNDAFSRLEVGELKSLMEDKNKASLLLKNHILTEVLCCSGVGPQTWGFNSLVPTLSHQHQSVARVGNHIRIGSAAVVSCDKITTNGVIHSINKLLIPQQARTPGFGFFLFDF